MRDPPRLIIHGVSAEAWTRRHGVEPFTHPCCVCGRPLTTSLPFVQGTLRGLIAPKCECGNDKPPFAIIVGDDATGPFTFAGGYTKPRRPGRRPWDRTAGHAAGPRGSRADASNKNDRQRTVQPRALPERQLYGGGSQNVTGPPTAANDT